MKTWTMSTPKRLGDSDMTAQIRPNGVSVFLELSNAVIPVDLDKRTRRAGPGLAVQDKARSARVRQNEDSRRRCGTGLVQTSSILSLPSLLLMTSKKETRQDGAALHC